MTLWCQVCARAVAFSSEVPAKCATCGGTKWKALRTADEPREKVYKLSENDRRLLRGLRIDPEV